MEKILLVMDAHKSSVKAIDFGCYLARTTQTKLTGLFIENLYYHEAPAHEIKASYFNDQPAEETLIVTDTGQAIRIFKEQCRKNGIKEEVLVDTGEPIQKVLFESRYADVLVLDPQINFFVRAEEQPSHFLKSVLMGSECPVLLSAHQFTAADEIVFCFDGSASAVYSCKLFTYLFPQFTSVKAVLLEVKDSSRSKLFDEDHQRMMNWLRAHYTTVYYQVLEGNAKDELLSYFFMHQNKIVVMGAYGRSMLSKFIRRSGADPLIQAVDLPLFITHY